MKKIIFSKVILLAVILTLVNACSTVPDISLGTNAPVQPKMLVATGYSQLRYIPQLTEEQNRLAIEQSAKIEAYRNLAKQLYVEKLSDDLSVANQVIKDEIYRVYLELFMREARVVESTKIADQKRVQLQLALTPRFYQCFSTSIEIVTACLQQDNKIPFTRIGYQPAAFSTINLACATASCADQLSVGGFSNEKHGLDNALLNLGLYDTEWTVNMGAKVMLRYLYLTGFVFN